MNGRRSEKSCSFDQPCCLFLCLFVALTVSHFGIEGRTLVLIALVSGHFLPFTFYIFKHIVHFFLFITVYD